MPADDDVGALFFNNGEHRMGMEVLAVYRAKKLVKEMIRRRGEKLSEYTVADIKTLAEAWAAEHKEELVAEAKRMIASSPELQKMYEKEQRQRRS
jgi:hypothetical protein